MIDPVITTMMVLCFAGCVAAAHRCSLPRICIKESILPDVLIIVLDYGMFCPETSDILVKRTGLGWSLAETPWRPLTCHERDYILSRGGNMVAHEKRILRALESYCRKSMPIARVQVSR